MIQKKLTECNDRIPGKPHLGKMIRKALAGGGTVKI